MASEVKHFALRFPGNSWPESRECILSRPVKAITAFSLVEKVVESLCGRCGIGPKALIVESCNNGLCLNWLVRVIRVLHSLTCRSYLLLQSDQKMFHLLMRWGWKPFLFGPWGRCLLWHLKVLTSVSTTLETTELCRDLLDFFWEERHVVEAICEKHGASISRNRWKPVPRVHIALANED
jgi:hypothetical protein